MATKRNDPPKRLRRDESFFGIHFDRHVGPGCTEMGKTLDRGVVRRLLDAVRPDFVQVDCKGHKGLASYPTEVGYPGPGFVRDPLRIWRDATSERGVALYVHYSGVLDAEACRRHPSWVCIGPEGRRHGRATSVFGPYVEKLLVPQLRELAAEYDVDGAWVDGECWGIERDYSKKALEAFRRETGIDTVPRSPEDPHYQELLDFSRQAFRDYLEKYVDAIHAAAPGFQVASNWAYSSYMPEPVATGVDFLSGDSTPGNPVHDAGFEGRCLASQGRPWDLMAWSFKWNPQWDNWHVTRTAVHLKQEAAVVLALGGGYQAYFKQTDHLSIHAWQVPLMAELARFCRARQAVCHRAESVPQVGFLFAASDMYRRMKEPFRPWSGEHRSAKGVLQCLLASQVHVDVLMEHHLAERAADFPLIVVPDCVHLSAATRRRLRDYVEGGGNLLLVGHGAAAQFRKPLRIRFRGKAEARTRFLEANGWFASLTCDSRPVRLDRGAKAFGRLHEESDPKSAHEPAASIARLGKGRIAAVYHDLGTGWRRAETTVARDFLGGLVRELFPRPTVEVDGSHDVQVVLKRTGGHLAVNLVNMRGPHADHTVATYDELPPVGPLEVTIRPGRKPRRIRREPAGESLEFRWSRGQARVTLPCLELHDVLVVEA